MAFFLNARVNSRNTALQHHKERLREELKRSKSLKDDAIGTLPSNQPGCSNDLLLKLDEEFKYVKSRLDHLFDRIDSAVTFINCRADKRHRQAILRSRESESILKEVQSCDDLCEAFQELVLSLRHYVLCKSFDPSRIFAEIELHQLRRQPRHPPPDILQHEFTDLPHPPATRAPKEKTPKPPKTSKVPKTPKTSKPPKSAAKHTTRIDVAPSP